MLRRPLLVLTCALLLPIVPYAIIGELPGDVWLTARNDDAWAFGGIGALLLASDLLLPIPSSVIGTLLGGRLGFGLGFVSTLLGLSAGQALGYALGRLWRRRFSTDAPTPSSAALVFLSRPVPVFAEAVAIAAGATRMPWTAYAGSMLLGNALYALALAGNGALLMPAGLAGPGLVLPMLAPVLAYLLYARSTKP
jgi:membrane protein DedA with SNARE-associated domain